MGVQNLIKKHNAVTVDVLNHEPMIECVAKAADDLVDEGHYASPDIRDRRNALVERWNRLKGLSAQRKQDLEVTKFLKEECVVCRVKFCFIIRNNEFFVAFIWAVEASEIFVGLFASTPVLCRCK